MFGGTGIIESEETVSPDQCEKVWDQDQCFEKCVNDDLDKSPPDYAVQAGRAWLFPTRNTQ